MTFEAQDAHGDVIYHTDCLMSLLGKHAFICVDALRDKQEKNAVLDALAQGDQPLEPILLSFD